MEQRLFRGIIALSLLSGLLCAQEPGTYKGEWTGTGASGEIHMTFKAGATPEVGFTLGDQVVKTKILSFKPEGAKFTLVYEFDAQGAMLQSAIEGTVKGKTLEGTYKTTAGDQAVDSGTWKAVAP